MFNKKGQSTLEYALVIAVIVAGLLVMQLYLKRGYSGRLKSSSDDIGEQFDPAAYRGNFTINKTSNIREAVTNRATTKNYLTDSVDSKTGNESVTSWTNTTNLYDR